MRTEILIVLALTLGLGLGGVLSDRDAGIPTASGVPEDGMVVVESAHSVAETAERLRRVLQQQGLTVFDRIDHHAGAQEAGLTLRPTTVLIFGNPNVGTPLMQCEQRVAIDLPQKALIWEDADGRVWLGYNDPAYLAERHDVSGCGDVLATIEQALGNLAEAATAPDAE